MKIGLQIPNFNFNNKSFDEQAKNLRSELLSIGKNAECAGFYSIWVMDHFFQIGPRGVIGPAEDFMMEGYSTLNFLSAITEKVKLGTLVTGNIYRYPGLLVKTVTTLDVLSGGRAYFGIGAGWFERESLGLGVPYPPLKERFERFEETLKLAKQMFSSNNGEFNGKYYKLKETLNHPEPLQKPHPPILIGGTGPTKTLKFVAKYANACNLFSYGGPSGVKANIDIIKKHCKTVGRDFNEIEITTLGSAMLDGEQTADDLINYFKGLNEVGVTHAIVNTRYPSPAVLKTFKDTIIPAVKDL